MKIKRFGRNLRGLFFLIATASIFCSARAQTASLLHTELTDLDSILDHNSWLAIDLTGRPALLQSASFLRVHSELGAYLKSHPDVSSELISDPKLLVARERRFLAAGGDQKDQGGNRVKRSSIDWLDLYFQQNPALQDMLRHQPALIDATTTVSRFPELAQLFKRDPALTKQFKLHPGAYLNH